MLGKHGHNIMVSHLLLNLHSSVSILYKLYAAKTGAYMPSQLKSHEIINKLPNLSIESPQWVSGFEKYNKTDILWQFLTLFYIL